MSCHICRAAGFLCGKCRQEKEKDRINASIPTDRMDTYHPVPVVDGPRYGERRR